LLREFSRISEQSTSREKNGVKREDRRGEKDLLTMRQKEVLELVAAGLTYKEVGASLSLSEVTIRYHMSEIMEHLHLEHRSQVIAYAANHGLIK
jgi:two-component system NarL family response regulator